MQQIWSISGVHADDLKYSWHIGKRLEEHPCMQTKGLKQSMHSDRRIEASSTGMQKTKHSMCADRNMNHFTYAHRRPELFHLHSSDFKHSLHGNKRVHIALSVSVVCLLLFIGNEATSIASSQLSLNADQQSLSQGTESSSLLVSD